VSIRLSRGTVGSLALGTALLVGPVAAATAAGSSYAPPPSNPNPTQPVGPTAGAATEQGQSAQNAPEQNPPVNPDQPPQSQAPSSQAPPYQAPPNASAPNASPPNTDTPAAPPADPLAGLPLPDLAMAPTRDLKVVNRPDGHTELRFTSTVVNIGHGLLVVAAHRDAVGKAWTVAQEILSPAGSVLRAIGLPLQPVWGGDGHNHWHVPGVAKYQLLRLSDNQLVGANHKIGFCFFDNSFHRALPETPDKPEFPNDQGCAHGDRRATHFRMGLSVGWGDVYRWKIPGQSIDISNVPAGRYRLLGMANGDGLLLESDRSDNLTWIDFELVRHGNHATVRILDHGSDERPAQPDHGSVGWNDGPDESSDNSAAPQCDAVDPTGVDCSRRG
jgi:hypothetical protein